MSTGHVQIREIKKTILKKKIMLNIVIENSSFWDNLFRWVHLILALLAPGLAFISRMISGSSNDTKYTNGINNLTIILSSLVVGMIK